MLFLAIPALIIAVSGAAAAQPLGVEDNTRRLPALPSFEAVEDAELATPQSRGAPVSRRADGGATFGWRAVAFEGASLFDEATLRGVVADLMTAETTVVDLEIARTRLTKFYTDAGFINSGALLPGQNVASGLVRFSIVEGRLSEVRPLGQAIGLDFGPGGQLHPDYVTDRLAIDPDAPLNVNDLRETFGNLLEDRMITRLDGRLLPGDVPGEAVLEIEVDTAPPFELALSLNNENSVSNGALGADLSAQIRNVTGMGEFTDIDLSVSEGRKAISAAVDMPIGAGAWIPYIEATYAQSEVVEEPFDVLDIENEFLSVGAGARWLAWKGDTDRVTLIGSLEHKRSRTTLLGRPFPATGTDSDVNSATIVRFAQEFVRREQEAVTALRSSFSVGLPIFGATRADRGFADGSFLGWLGQAQHTRRLNQNVSLVLRGQAQWSMDPLLSFEKIGLGGVGTVRGYRQNAITRDIAVLGSVELPVVAANAPIPGLTGPDGQAPLTIAPFVDYGIGWNKGASGGAEQNLLGVGVGFTYRPNNTIRASLTYGRPVIDGPGGAGERDLTDEAIYFNVTFTAF